METYLISSEQIKQIVDMKVAVEVVDQVYSDHGAGKAILPPKINLPMGEHGEWPHYYGSSNSMPAYVDSLHAMGVKFASGYKKNPEKGLPFINALIILTEAETGLPEAVLDGTYITAIRTGAATGVGVNYLYKDADQVGIIGSGLQGEMNLRALNEVLQIKKCYINDINEQKAIDFRNRMQPEFPFEILVADRETLCRNSQVIVSATVANEALVEFDWLQRPCVVVPLGSYQEVADDVVMKADKIIVDNIAQTSHRGELHRFFDDGRLDESKIYSEIGGIVHGSKPFELGKDELVVLCQIGMGSLDIGLAKYVFDKLKPTGKLASFKF